MAILFLLFFDLQRIHLDFVVLLLTFSSGRRHWYFPS